MIILVKLLQRENAESPMIVTLSGIVMLVKLLQSSNARNPIVVTLFGIVMLVKSLQNLNAESHIVLVPSFIVHFDTFAFASIRKSLRYKISFSQFESSL